MSDQPLRCLSPRDAAFIEGYAAGLCHLMEALTGEQVSAKSYDPMTVRDWGTLMHSYAFDMKDGGRHHAVSDYKSVEEICAVLLNESKEFINDGPK